ncbi:uncharacterized protein LOC134251173 [Saccostrea cucullata]|uniref:uncharacterized protein LOC134251173 n=1 Tax=Saccostrea cuccullata TaxID=36930 RepID=UPI002ED6A3DD
MASCGRWTVLLLVVVIETVDLFCDWLFYTQVKDSSESYIKNHAYLHWVIFGVAILGTLTFVFEVINLAVELFRKEKKSCLMADTVSMLSTWVEDVPQIAVALAIAANSKSVVHWIQYVKAGWAVLEVAVRALGQCIYCCRISDRPHRSTDFFVSLCKFLAQIVVLGCSVGILLCLLQENQGN